MFLSHFVAVFLVTGLCSRSSLAASRASFGEACSKEIRCDSRNFLACSSTGVCDCFMGDSMVYDNSTRKCATLAGERCLFSTVEGERSWNDELPCISGATCANGICECLSRYYELPNGTCSPKKGYGGECVGDQMCDPSQHLSCGNDGLCVCDASRGLILDGAECRLRSELFCSQGSDVKCVTGACCDNSECTCDNARYVATNGTCLLKHLKGEACQNNKECLQFNGDTETFLVCSEGRCECDSVHSVEEVRNGSVTCKRQLGRLCKINDCLQGADFSGGTCLCTKETHFQTENQTCQIRSSFGGDCDTDEGCISALSCNGKKCSCASSSAFVHTSQECRRRVGSLCSPSLQECVPGAYCYDRYTSEYGYRYVCTCEGEFTESNTGDGLCYVVGDRYCDGDTYGPPTNTKCLPRSVCRENVCKSLFGNHQKFNEDKKEWLTFVGGPCSSSSDCSVPGSECGTEFGVQQCVCKQGFIQNGRKCMVAYGGACKTDSPRSEDDYSLYCDMAGGLECTSNGVCNCPALQEYSVDEKVCQGLVGADCSSYGKNFCMKGSYCKFFRGSNSEGICACQDGFTSSSDRRCREEKVIVNNVQLNIEE